MIQPAIANPLVCDQQADLLGNRAAHERFEKIAGHAVDDAGNDLPVALDRANDRCLARSHAAAPRPAALVPMPVLRLAADEGFVNLDDAHELAEIFVRHPGAKAMRHVPSCFQRTEIHHPPKLARADPFLAGQHQMQDAEPVAERLIGVLENRPADMREAVIGSRGRARVAQPVPFHGAVRLDVGIAATRANDKLGPAVFGEIQAARIFVGESRFPFRDRHLVDLLRLFGAGHLGSPVQQGREWHA